MQSAQLVEFNPMLVSIHSPSIPILHDILPGSPRHRILFSVPQNVGGNPSVNQLTHQKVNSLLALGIPTISFPAIVLTCWFQFLWIVTCSPEECLTGARPSTRSTSSVPCPANPLIPSYPTAADKDPVGLPQASLQYDRIHDPFSNSESNLGRKTMLIPPSVICFCGTIGLNALRNPQTKYNPSFIRQPFTPWAQALCHPFSPLRYKLQIP